MTVKNGQTKYTLKTIEAAVAFEGFAMENNLQSNIAMKDNLGKREVDNLQESPLLKCIVWNLWAIVRKCLVPKIKECN